MTSTRKLRAEHTIADILRIKPKWFMDKQGNKTNAEENLKYIHTLLEYGLNHMANVPFVDVFPAYIIDHSPEYRGEINKALMTYEVGPVKRTQPTHFNPVTRVTRLSLIPPNELRTALKPDFTAVRQEVTDLTTSVNYFHEDVAEWQREINNYYDRIQNGLKAQKARQAKLRALQLMLEEEAKHIDPERKRLLESIPSQWLVIRTTPDSFFIMRRTPITLNYIGTAESGMAKSLYMGYFILSFDWTLRCRSSAQVADYIDTGSSGSIHPHLSGASICWGNQAHKAERYQQERDYKAYFELLENILTIYCPDNPFISFDTIERRRKNHYHAVNNAWFVQNDRGWARDIKKELMNIIAETASDKFMEVHKSAPQIYVPRCRDPKNLKDYAIKVLAQVREKQEQINTILANHGPLQGESVLNVLKGAGIYLPDREVFLRTGMINPHDVLGSQFISLMLMAYRTLPFFGWDSNTKKWKFREVVAYMPSYLVKWRNVTMNLRGTGVNFGYSVATNPLSPEDTTDTTSVDIVTYDMDAARVNEVISTKYRPPSPPAPAVVDDPFVDNNEEMEEIPEPMGERDHWYNNDYEHAYEYCNDNGHDFDTEGVCNRCGHECEHEDHESNGECTYCGVYNSDYDEDGDN